MPTSAKALPMDNGIFDVDSLQALQSTTILRAQNHKTSVLVGFSIELLCYPAQEQGYWRTFTGFL